MDWSALIWLFSGVGATLVGVYAQYRVSKKIEESRRKTEFYKSRLEKIQPWLADLEKAVTDLNIDAIGTIHVPDAGPEHAGKQYWRAHRLQMLKDSVNKIDNLGDNPPHVVFASLDPEVAQSLDSIFRKIAHLRVQAVTVIYEVEKAIRQDLPLTEEWEQKMGPPIIEGSEALRAEIAVLAGLLKELTLRTDVRRSV